jgi:hypothetical protein
MAVPQNGWFYLDLYGFIWILLWKDLLDWMIGGTQMTLETTKWEPNHPILQMGHTLR